ncbi:copper resistance CopC family protein [Aeromicrobium piscarium]|uniref:Copper resistance protein CopC n=1 Tax=Aeromicrobium piscarium TaxID=2590901 RepID=A0A554RFS7_9ACTN|nr:copper resistance CopC family protein [Aeromicrobium piscarium]TSD52965.1 copper resistance protein CopC [Aeromicrobium piscarium]
MRLLTRSTMTLSTTLLVAGSALTGTGPASAHAQIVQVDPADHAVVKDLDAVSLTLDEQPAPGTTSVAVVNSSDSSIAMGEPIINGTTVTQKITPEGPAGTYTIGWRVTSSDGHPIAGTSTFIITNDDGSAPGIPAGLDPQAIIKRADNNAFLDTDAAIFITVLLVGAVLLLAITRRRRYPQGSDHAGGGDA